MAQVTEGVQTEQSSGWGVQLLAYAPRFMLVCAIVLVGVFIALRAFVGEFVADSKLALMLTAIGCGALMFLPALVILFIWAMRETSKATAAGIAPQIERTHQLVETSIAQTGAAMDALIAVTGAMTNGKAPLQLSAGIRTPKRFELGQFADANNDGKDDDDVVEVWVKQGSQYKKVTHSFALLDDFIRMANPSRAMWTHANDAYGVTANIIEAIDGSPLVWEGNQYKWRVAHEQVVAWWEAAQKT